MLSSSEDDTLRATSSLSLPSAVQDFHFAVERVNFKNSHT